MVEKDFGTLDDAMVCHEGRLIYAHALVLPQEGRLTDRAHVYFLTGSREEIYSPEKEKALFTFLNGHITDKFDLYASTKYRRYSLIWQELVSEEVNRSTFPRLSDAVRLRFYESQEAAKKALSVRLDSIIKEESKRRQTSSSVVKDSSSFF